MAVRNTERYIPGGFENASALGYSQMSSDNAIVVVSYLGPTIQIDETEKSIKYRQENGSIKEAIIYNRYVFFVDPSQKENIDDFAQYSWEVTLINKDGSEINLPPQITYIGVFDLFIGLEDISNNDTQKIALMRVKVTVTDNVGNNLVDVDSIIILHKIAPLNGFFEIFASQNINNSALQGNLLVGRQLANDFREYIKNASERYANVTNLNGFSAIPPELIVAKLYLSLLKYKNNWILDSDNNMFEKILNQNNFDWEKQINIDEPKIGIVPIKISNIAMIIPENFKPVEEIICGQYKPICPLLKFDGDNVKSKNILKNFYELPPEFKIKIFNLLRFPKSNILWISFAYDKLKYDYDKEIEINTKNYKTVVKKINCALDAYPYDFAKTKIEKKLLKKVKDKCENIFFSAFVANIVQNFISYEDLNPHYSVIKIHVLDIRSGFPIQRSKVKKLIIRGIGENKICVGDESTFLYAKQEIAITSKNAIKSMQMALFRLGYFPAESEDNCKGKWDENTMNAYNQFWEDRYIDISTDMTEPVPAGDRIRFIVDEYNIHAYTNENGVLNIRIPKKFKDNNNLINIEIGFWEMPIILESISSKNSQPMPSREKAWAVPNFTISWPWGNDGTHQEVDWDKNIKDESHFGWQVTDANGEYFLKSALLINLQGGDSKFYDEKKYPYNFVLFGMKWCQPVWDEFEDTEGTDIGAINLNSYLVDSVVKNINMHIVTMCIDLGGTRKYGGKGYGRAEGSLNPKWRGTDGHLGIDINARVGALVFAIHGGIAYNLFYPPNGLDKKWHSGRHVRLKWLNNKLQCAFLHLSEFVDIIDKTPILCGTIIARAGRTGNFNPASNYLSSSHPTIWAGHVHLNIGVAATGGETIGLKAHVDPYNQIVIPDNRIPLLFPCRCEVTKVAESPEASNCNFEKPKFIERCWAAAEIKCPYINPNAKTNIQLQVQLRFLNEKPVEGEDVDNFIEDRHSEYFHPGSIDGQIGIAPEVISGSSIPKNSEVSILEAKYNGLLVKIKYSSTGSSSIKTWVSGDLIDDQNKTKEEIFNIVKETSIIGKTRMAIYKFRQNNNFLDYNNYAENFSMNDEAWNKLNEVTGLTTQNI